MLTIQEMIDLIRSNPNVKYIALEGGPGGGKSTFMKMAKQLLEAASVICFFIPEVAREFISAGFVPGDTRWKTSVSFQRQIFLAILEKEARYFQMIQEMNLGDKPVVVWCDRGLPGGIAYCGDEPFGAMLRELGIPFASILDRYHGVIHLVTAADGAPEFYVNDDERRESPEEAIALDQRTFAAWQQHTHICRIDNSTDFPTKINRALLALKRTIGFNMQLPQEIEAKFRVDNFSLDQLPSGAKSFEIEQIYLNLPDRPGLECRVRLKMTCGEATFSYTEKTETTIEGVRGEFEEAISLEHFNELVTMYADKKCQPVVKTRYKFPEGGHVFEVDVYSGHLVGLVVMEVEVPTVEDLARIKVPLQFTVTDVTSDKRYSNRSLAEHSIPG